LSVSGWRAVEPATEDAPLPAVDPSKPCDVTSAIILDKETQAPGRYTDGSLVKAMETSGRDTVPGAAVEGRNALDEEALEELKERGLGTPATRAAIVKDLIQKGLARRQGRSILPTPARLHAGARGAQSRPRRSREAGDDRRMGIPPRAHGAGQVRPRAVHPRHVRAGARHHRSHPFGEGRQRRRVRARPRDADAPLPALRQAARREDLLVHVRQKKEGCGFNLSKDQNGKYLFPETARRLLERKRIGPMGASTAPRRPVG
jgi:DNA topoisomerase-3